MARRVLDMKRLRELPVQERLQAVEDLWDSIVADDPDMAVPLTPALIEELDRRLAEHETSPGATIPWEKVRDELRASMQRRRKQ